jgi:hypothetical protein
MEYNSSVKSTLFILLSFFSFSTWACKCDPAVTNGLRQDPLKAKAIFSAVVESGDGGPVLRRQWSWREGQEVYRLDTTSSCRPALSQGRRYMVLTSNAGSIHVCGTVFIPLEQAGPIVEALLKMQERFNPSWFYCNADDECETFEGLCRIRTVIRKGHQETYMRQVHLSAPNPICPPVSWRPVYAKCRDNFCSPEFN